MDKPVAPDTAVEYYLSEIRNSAGPVLEPMCGAGRFLIPFLVEGIEIDGTDASFEMLNRCMEKCKMKNLRPVLYYQKIQDLTLQRNYGFMFIPAGSFGLITEDNEIKESLKRMHYYLKPGGVLILEIQTPYQIPEKEKIYKREVKRDEFSKIQLTSVTEIDTTNNIETTKYEYYNIDKGNQTITETETIKVKLYKIKEFTEILQSSGFSEIKSLRPYSQVNATGKDEMILFKCRKMENKFIE